MASMRAKLIIMVITMPWLNDMKAMSGAIAQQAAYGQRDIAPVQE